MLTRVVQYYRCQQFGQFAQNCKREEKCVRRGDLHKSSHCPNTDPKCANCGENHPASYRKCPNKPDCAKTAKKICTSVAKQTSLYLKQRYDMPQNSRHYPKAPPSQPSQVENRACSLAGVLKLFTNISREQLQTLMTLIQVLENPQLIEIISHLVNAYGK